MGWFINQLLHSKLRLNSKFSTDQFRNIYLILQWGQQEEQLKKDCVLQLYKR